MMNKLKNKLLFIFSLFSITILNLQVVFATNKSNSTIKGTGKEILKSGKDAISKVVNSNASFLAQESFIQNISWAQMIYYFILPLAVFAILLIVINSIIFRKNIDTAMILVGVGLTIGLQFLLFEPLNNISSGNILNNIGTFFSKLFNSDAKISSEIKLFPWAIIFDIILGFVGLAVHNLFIDHRVADKSQGIKVIIGQIIVCVILIALKTNTII